MNYECIEEAYTLIALYGHMGMPTHTTKKEVLIRRVKTNHKKYIDKE